MPRLCHFETQDGRILASQFVPNPGHRPEFLPVFLHKKGVTVIISGEMGQGAIDIFNEKGVEVIAGASGDAEGPVNSYLQGNLKSTGSVCHHHQHASECGE